MDGIVHKEEKEKKSITVQKLKQQKMQLEK
jgi:hypothetical protein